MSKFNDKYRIETTRIKEYDYSNIGKYFVTICTHNRYQYFGKITNSEMKLNDCGIIAEKCLTQIPEHFPKTVIESYVIMPNHLHFIIFITETDNENLSQIEDKTLRATSLQKSNISPKQGTLSTIIRSYKSAVTNLCNKNNIEFKWQARFYEHVIRNEKSLFEISSYIQNNVINWELDELFENT